MAMAVSRPPEQGQLVTVRQRRHVVADIAKSTLLERPLRVSGNGGQQLASLSSVDDDAQRITLVSYAVHRIPWVREASVRAARPGVRIKVIVETPNRLEGQGEYDTLQALGADVANCAIVYYLAGGAASAGLRGQDRHSSREVRRR
jgi:hypothetical protein